MAVLSLEGLTKRYGEVVAIDNLSLEVGSGEFVSLLGGSGCGKTTVLRIVAGFATADRGRVKVDGRDITHQAPSRRQMGFVFQSYALFPSKTVQENIAFAPSIAGRPAKEVRARVDELAALVEIEGLLQRFPHELSGGQQQRVALARALAAAPQVLLLDEPLSVLDAKIRARLREEVRRIVDRLAVTALYVTHDQEEALAISDRVAVMRHGRIEQVGHPRLIYERPATRFVADFVGTTNWLRARVADRDHVTIDGQMLPTLVPDELGPGDACTVAVRPERVVLLANGEGLPVEVAGAAFLGPVLRLRLMHGDAPILADLSADLAATLRPGQTLRVGWRSSAVAFPEPEAGPA